MSRILICLLTICSLVSHSVSQERFSYLTLSGGVSLTKYSEGIHKYSAPGWSLGVGLAHDVSDYARVVVEGVYQRFAVDVERVYSSHPNTKALGWPIRGQASQVFGGSVGFRIAFTTDALRPYAAIGGGVMFLESGGISFVESMPNIVRGSENEVLGFVFLGLGIEFSVTDFLSSSISAEISTAFEVRGVTVPITSRWYLRL